MDLVCKYHYEKKNHFLALRKQVPSFGPDVDKALAEYLDLAGKCLVAICTWYYGSKCYFGEKGLGETRTVPLMLRSQED